MPSASAIAHPNIAFIKYWGVQDPELNLPASSSLSMTLGGLDTRTTVTFDSELSHDSLELNGEQADAGSLKRASNHLDRVRQMAKSTLRARVTSTNSFPASAGIASSASGYAALTLAAATALNLDLSSKDLSVLARRGSGSAARSAFGGFVIWHKGEDDQSSFAEAFLPPDHWSLVDWIAVVDQAPKMVGSREGHRLADTSPLQAARVASAPQRLLACRQAVADRDFQRLAPVVELDSNLMHAVMMTSAPPLLYWAPASLRLMREIAEWRAEGIDVCYTLDAGPTVHCITTDQFESEVEARLHSLPEVQLLLRGTPGPAPVVEATTGSASPE
jgi:diphosphomevalonate decarboxylase